MPNEKQNDVPHTCGSRVSNSMIMLTPNYVIVLIAFAINVNVAIHPVAGYIGGASGRGSRGAMAHSEVFPPF